MSAREDILATIKNRLNVSANDSARKSLVQARLRSKPVNTKPTFASLLGDEKLDWFKKKALEKGTQIHIADDHPAISRIIARVAGSTPVCATQQVIDLGLTLELANWQAKSSSSCCVSTCECAIAETGSLVLTSDAKTPISQIFLADVHIVLLKTRDIEQGLEAVWSRIRDQANLKVLPRDITLVSGPSSTGDIELQMEKGAHGPRELHVVLYDDLMS